MSNQLGNHHASVDTKPRGRTVTVIRYRKPGKTSQVTITLSRHAAERRADKLRSEGADVAVYAADVTEWTEVA